MSTQPNHYGNYLSKYFSTAVDQKAFRSQKIAYLKANYMDWLPANTSVVLEIGPGYGEMIELLNKSGFSKVSAIDLSPEVVEECNRVMPNSTSLVEDSKSYLESCKLQFDSIFMFHVLEHVSKDKVIPLLQAARHAIKPQGKLILEVPNMGQPLVGLNSRYADFTHEVGFTSSSLAFVLKSSGFEHIEIRGADLAFDRWYRPLQRGARRIADLLFKAYQYACGVRGSNITSHAICARSWTDTLEVVDGK